MRNYILYGLLVAFRVSEITTRRDLNIEIFKIENFLYYPT